MQPPAALCSAFPSSPLFAFCRYPIILWICWLALSPPAKAQNPYPGMPIITHFTTEDYQAGIQNWDFSQDEYGLLYVANNFGLLVYDGSVWHTIPVNQATRIRAVLANEQQRIYMGGQGNFGYHTANENGTLTYTPLYTLLPDSSRNFDEIWKIYTIGPATYFCSFNYIFRWENEQLIAISPHTTIGFSFQIQNQLLTHFPKKGLMRLNGDTFELIPNGQQFAGQDIRSILPFDQDRLLVATRNNGLYLLSEQSVEPWQTPINPLIAKAQINTAIRLSNNTFAFGTQNGGLFVVGNDGQLIHSLNQQRGLNNNTVLSLYEDHLGNLWAGLNNGISYIELDQPFSLINSFLGITSTGYAAAKTDQYLYLGTSNGLFARPLNYPTHSAAPFIPVPQAEGQVYTLQVIDNEVFLGLHQGAMVVSGMQVRPIEGLQGVWKFLKIPGSQRLLVGTYTGMYLVEKKQGNWQVVKHFDKLQESSRKYEMDDAGRVWMSHGYKGVFRLEFDASHDSLLRVTYYNDRSGFPSNILINVFKVGNQLLYAAEKGIYRYAPETDRFVLDTAFSAFFGSAHVRELEEDLQGNVYFLTDHESGVLLKDRLGHYTKQTANFGKITRSVSDDLENIIALDSRNVLIDAKEGFIHYDPERRKPRPATFATLIRSVLWEKEELFGGYFAAGSPTFSPPQLPYGKASLRFRFTSTFFEGTTHTQYQFQLENFENEWSAWEHQTEKEYTNLPEGRYVFRVRARNVDGSMGQPMSFPFVILPPWYRTVYAYLLYALFGAGLLVAGVVLLDQKYKQQQAQLMRSSQAAIEEKESQLKAVTAKSEQEITQLKNEKLEVEIQHKNRELASSAMHLINKNEFMSNLKHELNMLLKEEKGAAIVKGIQKLVKSIEKNLNDDESWKQFEYHFDEVHGDFVRKLKQAYPNLTPQELKLAAFLRMNMTTKEIAQLLNISVRGVEISRYRLRKKLPIDRAENLVEFMLRI